MCVFEAYIIVDCCLIDQSLFVISNSFCIECHFHTCVMRSPRVVLIVFLWILKQKLHLSIIMIHICIHNKNDQHIHHYPNDPLLLITEGTMKQSVIRWFYLSSQVVRSLVVVNMEVRVWGSQLQVVGLVQTTQDDGHRSLFMTESKVFDSLAATLEYAFHQSFSVMYSEQGAFSNAR